jgi:hypothetical protein
MTSKYILVVKIEPINTTNNNKNGANPFKTVDMMVKNEFSAVLKFESDKTSNISVVTATEIAVYANIFPVTDPELNDLADKMRITIPPAIRE